MRHSNLIAAATIEDFFPEHMLTRPSDFIAPRAIGKFSRTTRALCGIYPFRLASTFHPGTQQKHTDPETFTFISLIKDTVYSLSPVINGKPTPLEFTASRGSLLVLGGNNMDRGQTHNTPHECLDKRISPLHPTRLLIIPKL